MQKSDFIRFLCNTIRTYMERKAVKLNTIKNNSSLSFERYCNRFGIPTHSSLAVVVILYFVNGIFSTVGIGAFVAKFHLRGCDVESGGTALRSPLVSSCEAAGGQKPSHRTPPTSPSQPRPPSPFHPLEMTTHTPVTQWMASMSSLFLVDSNTSDNTQLFSSCFVSMIWFSNIGSVYDAFQRPFKQLSNKKFLISLQG